MLRKTGSTAHTLQRGVSWRGCCCAAGAALVVFGSSQCLFSEALFLYWATIVMCAADRDTNFRPHNNSTDNLFPVLLYIVPRSLQPHKTHEHSARGGHRTPGRMNIFLDSSCSLLFHAKSRQFWRCGNLLLRSFIFYEMLAVTQPW